VGANVWVFIRPKTGDTKRDVAQARGKIKPGEAL
jgi:hypothetical protein